MNYRFVPDAKDDLRDAVEFYESQRRGLGAEFAVEVGVGIAQVLEAPERWPEVEPGTRKYRSPPQVEHGDDLDRSRRIDRFPFGIFYRVPDSGTWRRDSEAHQSNVIIGGVISMTS
jgi:hypothetical protein